MNRKRLVVSVLIVIAVVAVSTFSSFEIGFSNGYNKGYSNGFDSGVSDTVVAVGTQINIAPGNAILFSPPYFGPSYNKVTVNYAFGIASTTYNGSISPNNNGTVDMIVMANSNILYQTGYVHRYDSQINLNVTQNEGGISIEFKASQNNTGIITLEWQHILLLIYV